jgi:hypothetical protein
MDAHLENPNRKRPLGFAMTTILLLASLTVAMPGNAQPAKPTEPAAKDSPTAAVAKSGKGKKAAKSKTRVRGAATAAKPVPISNPDNTATEDAVVEPTGQATKMDFADDDVAGTRMEPGYDPIQAGPKRARHGSMVPSSPKDMKSVVQGK